MRYVLVRPAGQYHARMGRAIGQDQNTVGNEGQLFHVVTVISSSGENFTRINVGLAEGNVVRNETSGQWSTIRVNQAWWLAGNIGVVITGSTVGLVSRARQVVSTTRISGQE